MSIRLCDLKINNIISSSLINYTNSNKVNELIVFYYIAFCSQVLTLIKIQSASSHKNIYIFSLFLQLYASLIIFHLSNTSNVCHNQDT